MPYLPLTAKEINLEFKRIKDELTILGNTNDRAKSYLENHIKPQFLNFKNAQDILPAHPKKFFLQNIEIGECYHMGAALCFSERCKYEIILENPPGGRRAYFDIQQTYLRGLAQEPDIEINDRTGDQKKGGKFLADKDIFHQTMLCKNVAQNPIAAHKHIFQKIIDSISVDPLDEIRNFLNTPVYIDSKTKKNKKREAINKPNPKIILWVRNKGRDNPNEIYRDMGANLIKQIAAALAEAKIKEIVLMGDAIDLSKIKLPGITLYNMTEYFSEELFQPMRAENSLAYQVLIPWVIFREYAGIGIIGMKSGAMDGPSFAGVPQIFIDRLKVDPKSYNAPYVKYAERMGLMALCDPFWNQLAVLRNDTNDLVFTDQEKVELQQHIQTLKDIRVWQLPLWDRA